MDDVLNTALWQFNEAVSLLRDAHGYLAPQYTALSAEISESLPTIQAALQAFADYQSAGIDGSEEG